MINMLAIVFYILAIITMIVLLVKGLMTPTRTDYERAMDTCTVYMKVANNILKELREKIDRTVKPLREEKWYGWFIKYSK